MSQWVNMIANDRFFKGTTMRFTLRGYGMLLAATGLALLSGCGGGGGQNSPSQTTNVNHSPVTTTPVWAPADATMNEYTYYTFTTTGTVADIGVTVPTYEWDFGDGSAHVITTAPTVRYAYTSAGTFTLQVRGTSSAGVTGDYAGGAQTVASATSPFTLTTTAPGSAATLQVGLGSATGTQEIFTFQVADSDGGTIAASDITLNPGDTITPAPTVGTPVSAGGGLWTIPVTYQAAAAVGTRTANPTVQVVDSLGIASSAMAFPAITVNTIATLAGNNAPVITMIAPTASTTAAFTSSTQTLKFALADADGDALTYGVDWGDGTVAASGSLSTNTKAGVSVSLDHIFPDSFAINGVATANVVVTCTDSRVLAPVSSQVTYLVTFNTYPKATISSPQASSILPAAVTAWAATTFKYPLKDLPALVVLPNNGMVSFDGAGVLPGSQEGDLSYLWDFNGGSPTSSDALKLASPGNVTFGGVAGEIKLYTVTLTVTDKFGRLSSADPTQATPVATLQSFQKTFERLVVVDGTDSQQFTISFLYRQRSGTSAPDTYSTATTSGHGLNAIVHIFQDGINNSYTVASGGKATTQIPVRSDVPFWLSIPPIAGDITDGSSYMFSIPNKPGLDLDLQASGSKGARTFTEGSEGTAFAFKSFGAVGPWDPQLQIITGSGFGTEILPATNRTFQGTLDLGSDWCPATSTYVGTARWLDRLSIPLTNPLAGSLPVNTAFTQPPNSIGAFSGIEGYQSIPEWFVFLKTAAAQDWKTLPTPATAGGFVTASGPNDLRFVIDDSTYNAVTAASEHWSASAMQAFRAPASALDPYDFDVMKLKLTVAGSTVLADGNLDPSQGLNPTPVAAPGRAFLANLVQTSPSLSNSLQGGLLQVNVPYDANIEDRIPNSPTTYNAFNAFNGNGLASNFGYAEYLWTKVWARPLVLNRTNLSYYDTWNDFSTFHSLTLADTAAAEECGSGTQTGSPTPLPLPWFFYSNPSKPWPKASNISGNASSFDLNVVNGGTFDASSPVTEGAATGTSKGVGRFFWTAFTPHYNAVTGALISRTWLANAASQIPTLFTGATDADPALSDACTAWGFLPPQDTQIDKRDRDANGTPITGSTSGGYRVRWFNPTKDLNNVTIPPDFWAVQVVSGGTTQVFLLSGNYPRTGQSLSDAIVTDCQTFLPSGQATYVSGDQAGPGYCWFDIPLELRPATGSTATVTIFGLKSILHNNAVSDTTVCKARVINRSEWVEAVKTVTASISTVPGTNDVSFAHKIAFNYPWDIVIVNGPATVVAR